MRWYLDLAIYGLTVAGKVWQLPGGPGAQWQAMGMNAEWCDTDLGAHATKAEAQQAVVQWVAKAIDRSAP